MDVQPTMNESRILDHLTDGDTGLLNATFFHLRLEEEFKKSWRFSWTYTLLLIDIDGLDEVEASEGTVGAKSTVLDIAGEVLTASRDVDLSARLGRTRFGMLLPGTPAEGALTMVRRVMESALERVDRKVTLSVGLTESPQDGLASADEFFARATIALDTAREQGANQVVTWNARASS